MQKIQYYLKNNQIDFLFNKKTDNVRLDSLELLAQANRDWEKIE